MPETLRQTSLRAIDEFVSKFSSYGSGISDISLAAATEMIPTREKMIEIRQKTEADYRRYEGLK